jgi:pseudaminic acid cytidylyltransferase
MSSIAIITARGGSKRIPRKNIKPFLGKPIIAYSIEAALASGLFAEVMVSTDDAEIAAIAKHYGATVPFMRSANNANDFAPTVEVIIEVLEEYRKLGKHFEWGLCLYPTAPFVTDTALKKAYETFMAGHYDTVFPVVPFSYPVYRGLKIEDGKTRMVWPENLTKRSQDLPTVYHDAGQFYMFKTEPLMQQKKLWTDNTASIILTEMETQDIDTEIDWQLAELKYRLLHGK